MSRRVIIRSRELNTAVAQLEEMVRAQYKELYKNHLEELDDMCDNIEYEAKELVPLKTGKLQNSIVVKRSGSNRYPGIIAQATAKNVKTNFDYALIQEENEEYKHLPGRMAHYLSGPFARAISDWYMDKTGSYPELNAELEISRDYFGNDED